MSQDFLELNDNIVYTEVDSRTEAIRLRDDAKDYSKETNKCVAIIFKNRYHIYLAPGRDPYQIRKEINQFMQAEPDQSSSDDKPKTITSTSKTSKSKHSKKK